VLVNERTEHRAQDGDSIGRGGEKCHPHGFVRVDGILATDFFTVDTLFGKRFSVFFILALKTRKIFRFSITSGPNREFARQQMILFDEEVPGGKRLKGAFFQGR